MQENNIPVRKERVLSDQDDNENWSISLPEEMLTAFVCSCDAVAYHLIRLLTDRGWRVPNGVSVVCFDDYLFSDLASPRITCYGVNVDGMAQTRVDQLCRRWNAPEEETLFQVMRLRGQQQVRHQLQDQRRSADRRHGVHQVAAGCSPHLQR